MAIRFRPRDDCNYKFNYRQLFQEIVQEHLPMLGTFRSLILNDLFFIVHFIMGIKTANHPFVVDRCREVEEGPKDFTLDIWAREHFKSTIITVAETAQYHLKHPDHCTGIFSFKKPAAEDFLHSIRTLYEADIMKACFPELLWERPDVDAPFWSLQRGIELKRPNPSRKERTIEANGLIEGMPTGRHYERRIYDDIETDDIADSPEQLEKCYSKFEMSDNLGKNPDGTHRVVGTFYSHLGPLIQIRDKKDADGEPMYHSRIIPATDDGTITGNPVLLTEDRWKVVKLGLHVNSQQLCDPTPKETAPFHYEFLKWIKPEDLPPDILKFMVIDPAGDTATQPHAKDAWAMGVFGVRPQIDELGTSDTYLLDLEAGPMKHSEAIEAAVRMYLRNGMIMRLGIEKVGQSTAEIHIANALRVHGRNISIDAETLVILLPGKIKKADRIRAHLEWPLNNGKMYCLDTIRQDHRDRLKTEMEKFPVWHDDILDIWAYLFELIKNYRFPLYRAPNRQRKRVKTGVV